MKQTPPAAVGRRHLLEISASAAGVIALSACSGSPPEPGKGRPDTTPEQEVPVTAPEDLMREHGVLKRILLIYREGILPEDGGCFVTVTLLLVQTHSTIPRVATPG